MDAHVADAAGEHVHHRAWTIRIHDGDVEHVLDRITHGVDHEGQAARLGPQQARIR